MSIKKAKSLSEKLRTLPVGEWHIIKNAQYKASTVKNTVSRLKKDGYAFMLTEKGCPDYIKIQRTEA
ncbi:MAG: hypothetical protein BGO30_07605 [Bacteroidetes bacterium 41-46]|nr:MAG: hypothetical protein BGO30_07605 [Bacteroidetes bacterium 41-46]